MIQALPFIYLQACVLISWWLLWITIIKKKQMRGALQALLLLFFFIAVTGWGMSAYRHYWPQRVIAHDSVLFVGPEKNFPKRGILSTGDQVVVEQKKDGWYYVSSSQGKGWVPAQALADEGNT